MVVEQIPTQPIYTIPSIRNYRWSTHLDLLRGIAALLVLIGHVRTFLFVEYSEISNPSFFIKRLNDLTSLGHKSVMVFFVLSGFFISVSVLRTIQKKQWSWVNYLVARLTRLYTVLIPALLLCAFWDFLGIKIFGTGQDSLYGEKVLSNCLPTYKILENLTFLTFLGNIAFLQTIFVEQFGSNKALWSLAYEGWYYIIFPFIILCFCVKSLKLRVFYAILTSAILLVVGSNGRLVVGSDVRIYFLVWLMGALIGLSHTSKYLTKGKILNSLIILSILILLCMTLVLGHFVHNQSIEDFIIGISTAFMIYLLVNDQTKIIQKGTYEKLARGLAGCSYTLYLVHMPILCFIRACLIHDSHWKLDILHIFLAIIISAFIFLYAVVIAHFTEAKTDKFRNIIMSWIKNRGLNAD